MFTINFTSLVSLFQHNNLINYCYCLYFISINSQFFSMLMLKRKFTKQCSRKEDLRQQSVLHCSLNYCLVSLKFYCWWLLAVQLRLVSCPQEMPYKNEGGRINFRFVKYVLTIAATSLTIPSALIHNFSKRMR